MTAHNRNKKLVNNEYVPKSYQVQPLIALTITFILCGIAYLFREPNLVSPADAYAFESYPSESTVIEVTSITVVNKEDLPEIEQIKSYIREVFGKESDNAFKVLSCENKALNPKATNHNRNGSIDRGIFQINSVHDNGKAKGKDMFNFEDNIDVAYKIYEEQGWSPWTCSHMIGVTPFYLR